MLSRQRRLLFSVVTTGLAFVLTEAGLAGIGALAERPTRSAPVGSGVHTLVCAGDSVTFGFGLPPEDAWPAQLARRPGLAAAGIRVVNAAVAGQDLRQIAMTLHPTLDFRAGPDRAVVLLGGHNDCAALGVPPPSVSSELLREGRRVLRSFTTYRLLAQVLARARPASAAPPSGARMAACGARLREGLEAVRAVVAASDTPLLVATYPVLDGDHRGAVSAYVNAAMLDTAVAAGVPTVDVAACAEARPGDLQADGVHLTAAGSAALAACLEAPVLRLFGR
ncbi:MAG: SGNH/GDSL hydrolase family protein [Myxococcota bacterium]